MTPRTRLKAKGNLSFAVRRVPCTVSHHSDVYTQL
jgi:hypothetical protein